MKITILQTDVKWAQPEDNQVVANKLISETPHSDLYILPEMWTTGFATSPEGIAEDTDSHNSLEWMQQMANENRCAICGSISVRTQQKQYRNRQYFVLPDGTFFHYDKHHLFSYGGEDKSYTAGTERVIAEYKGVRFLLQTCYDLRFPQWMRYKDDYDAIIIVANWPSSRQNAWQILLRARAIENQCYVIGANRVGQDKNSSYSGYSAIIDAKGQTLAQAQKGKEQTVTAEIDTDSLLRFRSKFPVLKDRDIF